MFCTVDTSCHKSENICDICLLGFGLFYYAKGSPVASLLRPSTISCILYRICTLQTVKELVLEYTFCLTFWPTVSRTTFPLKWSNNFVLYSIDKIWCLLKPRGNSWENKLSHIKLSVVAWCRVFGTMPGTIDNQ